MSVKIRLSRHGSKKKPFYRLIVADQRAPRDGSFIELLGWFDPMKAPKQVNIVPTDKNGIAFSRTPQQVLNIVYLGDSASSASFFPKGLNGAVK